MKVAKKMKRLSTTLEEIFENCIHGRGLESGSIKFNQNSTEKNKRNNFIQLQNGRRHEEYMKMENMIMK